MSWQIIQGDCREVLSGLEKESVQTCVTSPPYWGLRDYGADGQLGLEPTPEQYVANLVEVFREVKRVLRDDGTVWLNLGDSYAGSWGNQGRKPERGTQRPINGPMLTPVDDDRYPSKGSNTGATPPGLKPKDLVGIPWRVAFALQADGWWLRSDIVWAKPNPMPESVTDRPTRSHEYIFLLAKSARYFYDADAVREQDKGTDHSRNVLHKPEPSGGIAPPNNGIRLAEGRNGAGRNRRSVWTVTTQPYKEAHFATFPPKLIEPCILAGSPPKCCGECGAAYERLVERERWNDRDERRGQVAGEAHIGQQQRVHNTNGQTSGVEVRTLGWESTCDHDDDSGRSIVLDPFAGAGTTGVVATRHDRDFIGIELNPEYAEMARNRIRDDAPLLNTGIEVAA